MNQDRKLRELRPWFEGLVARMEVRKKPEWSPAWQGELAIPHREMKVILEADPVVSALLPGVPGYLTLGERDCGLFEIKKTGLVLFSPVLMQDAEALALAARLAFEALHAVRFGVLNARRLSALLHHARALWSVTSEPARAVLSALLPAAALADMQKQEGDAMSRRTMLWMSGLIEGAETGDAEAGRAASELELPLEHLLVAGGDNRLAVDPVSRLNAYGVCPRPRPEAVHFSSSTASAISEHGFLLADMLRRHLLDSWLEEPSACPRARLARVIADELAALMDYPENGLAMVLCASGTDSETAAVMVAHAGAEGRKLCNVLVSPEESGRGVVLAGEGRYFDSLTADGQRVEKGGDAFNGRRTEVREVAIRDEECRVLAGEVVGAQWRSAALAALAEGCHVLAHVLLGSKTGLTAPDYRFVEQLVAEAPERVDVVVDACQLRSSWQELRGLVERGWMVQISGSKFLTGPPFAGALLLPRRLAGRAERVRRMLAEGCGTGNAGDWVGWWQEPDVKPSGGSLGPFFRWLPALLEARLFASLPERDKRLAFEKFRDAILPRFMASRWIQSIDGSISDGFSDLARLSIISFQVMVESAGGGLRPLDESECKKLYRLLNQDLTGTLPHLSQAGLAAAALQCHIGQPVALRGARKILCFLRFVLGARFFNMIAHAGAGAWEAAVMAEISDASRVLDKIELLASRWDDLSAMEMQGCRLATNCQS